MIIFRICYFLLIILLTEIFCRNILKCINSPEFKYKMLKFFVSWGFIRYKIEFEYNCPYYHDPEHKHCDNCPLWNCTHWEDIYNGK